jgi:biotin synthase
MRDMSNHITEWKEVVLGGGEITFEQALRLIAMEKKDDLEMLFSAAGELTRKFHSQRAEVCSLINAKSYLCPEDCAFCAQSLHFHTGAERYGLLPVEEIVRAGKKVENFGILDFCIVTSGTELSDAEFEKVLEMCRRLKNETSLNVDGSLGYLIPERIKQLKGAGMRRINNNLQSSREFYPKIVSTHTYDVRVNALEALRTGGMEICSGGILAMGESREDRVRLAFELKRFRPNCLPVNLLNPRPGTPLEGMPVPEADEMIKTVAVFRFVHPRAVIKLAGGRERNLGPLDQERALQSGANGMIVGGYLTSAGNPIDKDFQILQRAGYELPAQTRRFEKPKAAEPFVCSCSKAADDRG